MSRTSDWAGQIRDDERRMDENVFGYTSYLEAMYTLSRERAAKAARNKEQQRKHKQPKQQK